MRKFKVIPIGIALVVAVVFLILVLAPGGCVFNLLPYTIHESMSHSGAGETGFVVGFDIAFAIGLFFLIRWIVNPMFRGKDRTNG